MFTHFKLEGIQSTKPLCSRVIIDVNNISGNSICVGDIATAEVDGDHRLGSMRNHTATHLLNAALHAMLTVTCQKSSQVTGSDLVFDFSVYGETFNMQNIVS